MLQTKPTLLAIMILSACCRATPDNYVALGDGYASGVGAGNYDPHSGHCKRSTRSYPALWAAANSPSSFQFRSCSGAHIWDIIASQLAPLSAATSLISLTAGATDSGLADTLTTCALNGERACLDRTSEARKYIANTLPAALDNLYSAIVNKAPAANVVVLGYPRLYTLSGTCSVGISAKSRAAINALIDDLNAVIAKRTADHGFVFGDVNETFAGHELCSGAPWLHSVTFPVGESYHPTATGHSGGYFPVFKGNV